MPGAYSVSVFLTFVRGYVRTNVRPSVRMCVHTYMILLDLGYKRYLQPFFGVVSVAQLVKTLDAAVLGAVAALVRACMAWARTQAKALRDRLRHLYQVEFCSFTARYPMAGASMYCGHISSLFQLC